MIDQASFKAGRLTFDIPAGCPNKAMFEGVVRKELNEHFGNDTNRAAFCKGEYDRCRDVPPDFRQNIEAQRHYQKAQMALSPGPYYGIGSPTPSSTVSWASRTMATNRRRQLQAGTWQGRYASPFATGRVIGVLNKARSRARQVTHERYYLERY